MLGVLRRDAVDLDHSYNPPPSHTEPSVNVVTDTNTGPADNSAAAASPADSSSAGLLLQVTPARVPRDLLVRARLSSDDPLFRSRSATVVQAPPGYGKTALLAQWRREFLAHGTVVAWFSAKESVDPQRFVQALALSVQIGSGRRKLCRALLEGAIPTGVEGVTAWLEEIARSALDVVVIVDEAERLPEATRESLTYLIHNAPPNLRVVVATRPECDLGVDELVSYQHCAVIGPTLLRFELAETMALARSQLGDRIDANAGARLHEMTEGWPLGLQLALAALAGSRNPRATIAAMSTRAGALHDYFVDTLLANLDPADTEFLERIAVLDDIHADLCETFTGLPDAAERLNRLARATPILIGAEGSDWLRMHAVARDALRLRFDRLPQSERRAQHSRASDWLAEHGFLEQAARHALAAGREQQAYDLAERCLYEAMTRRGELGVVMDWLRRVPAADLDRRPRLLLAGAWALALGEQHQESRQLVERILADPGVTEELRCECAMILAGAAGFADDPDRFAELHDPWAHWTGWQEPRTGLLLANRNGIRALYAGDPARARLYLQRGGREVTDPGLTYLERWGDVTTGLSYLWEGQVRLAERELAPALASAEVELGRRDPLACTLAATLAAAVWEQNRAQDAASLLSNRLDVIERSGTPETVMLAFRTAARLAAAEGTEHRALELLDGMHALGVSRNLPRLRLASLSDQVRLHAARFRSETCRGLCGRIDALLAESGVADRPLWRQAVAWMQPLAHAYAAIAAQSWRGALDPLADAAARVESIHLGRLRIEIMALRALALHRLGEKGLPLLKEAVDLAGSLGMARLVADAHPELRAWMAQVDTTTTQAHPAAPREGGVRPLAAPMQAPRSAAPPRANPSTALTPKEREVLELLARNLTNKEIALAMQIGEETIKWHLKNLFGKLVAGDRKQLVRRAHLLGLLGTPG